MLPSHRRWTLPVSLGDRISLSVFTFGGVFLFWYEIFWIWQTYNPTPKLADYVHVVIGVFLGFQIYANMFMLTTSDTSVEPVNREELSKTLLEGWQYCAMCQKNCPPRSHHCKICNVCILRRDHHCWFAGYCIGHTNHRYYLIMVVYIVITAVYSNLYNWSFVWAVKGEITVTNLLSFTCPHLGWMLGYYDLYTMAITFLSTIGFVLFILFSWLLQIQLAQLPKGQTKYERKKGIAKFNQGSLRKNLTEIVGDKTVMVFFLPWISSHLPNNGITFNEGVKFQ